MRWKNIIVRRYRDLVYSYLSEVIVNVGIGVGLRLRLKDMRDCGQEY